MPVTLKIAGRQFHPAPSPYPRDPLVLEFERHNVHDRNAIKVLAGDSASGEEGDQLGYIPAAAAAIMTLLCDETGQPIDVLFEARMGTDETILLSLKATLIPQTEE